MSAQIKGSTDLWQKRDQLTEFKDETGRAEEAFYENYFVEPFESVYLYEREPQGKNTGRKLSRKSTAGEYVNNSNTVNSDAQRKDKTSFSDDKKKSTIDSKKPKHKRGDPNIYDELEYELDNHNKGSTNKVDALTQQNSEKNGQISKKMIYIIITTLAVFLIGGAVIGVVVSFQGKYNDLFCFWPCMRKNCNLGFSTCK